MEEKQIFKEFRKGNKEAFKEFYRRYSLEMTQFAYSFLKDKKDSEDAVHDAFLIVLKNYNTWSSISDIRYYTFKVIQNLCLAKIRKNETLAKKENAYTYYQKSANNGLSTPPDIIQSINHQEIKRKVEWLFSFLSPQRKRAIELVYMEGNSYDEAAKIMGIGTESIRTHLRLARNILKDNLGSFIYFIVLYVIR
ncbi:RNA polymerase sigma factor [Chitinophaga niabensis]|uniref:RNA polymerase sigma factor n=1 Tax=Chitinophaga niabensis TaxID=536979 RepID=UPI0031B9F75E